MMHQSARSPWVRSCDPTPLLAFLLAVFAWATLPYPGCFVFRGVFLPVYNQADLPAQLGHLSWAPTVDAAHDLPREERLTVDDDDGYVVAP